ncbi:tail fiber protein [Maridesulfovibrio sp.]|uniref:tail fiber protein n=1 Tax=Maridesulfovibrio sp. TaxID=2795000 RepID=UPI0029C9F47D|nr:tail fiber protein [Maridesulfovibrio sp.]
MKTKEKRPMSFRTLIIAVSACIGLLAAILIALNYAPNAFAGDATSFNPTSVAVQARAASDTPIGGVIPYRGSSVPDGWLECNGQSTAGYPELAAVVGANVPDLRGEFIRGLDSGRGVDAGRTLGSAQDDAMEKHSHQTTLNFSGNGQAYGTVGGSSSPGSSGPTIGRRSGDFLSPMSAQWAKIVNIPFSGTGTGTSTQTGTADENRPRNVALMYIIKAE